MATQGKNLSSYDKDRVPNSKEFRFGVVVAEWNNNITEGLFKGVFQALKENGVINENIVRWNVPGSFELIYGCKKMLQSYDMLDAIIAVGSVIEGETRHFDFVCQAVSQGIKDLNVQYDTPVIFCVLTDQNMQQAIDRSGGKHGNKGSEAGITAIKMAQLRKDARF
jgi:6,7-dimethyl-8-ribityllumazine synthase